MSEIKRFDWNTGNPSADGEFVLHSDYKRALSYLLEEWQNREGAVCPEDVRFDDHIRYLEAENQRLRADASWAATHRSELADLRDAFAKAEALLRSKDEQLAGMREALQKVVDSSITCCPRYLEMVAAHLPMDATVQGWHKRDWIALNDALEIARAALSGPSPAPAPAPIDLTEDRKRWEAASRPGTPSMPVPSAGPSPAQEGTEPSKPALSEINRNTACEQHPER